MNLRPLNQFISYEHLMEGIHMLRDLLRKGRLYSQDRPEGCLFHSASLEEPPKVSEVCLERNDVRVCLSALRACKGPQSLNETYETCSGPVTRTGHQTDRPDLDDLLIMAQSRDIAFQFASTALDLLQGLGFTINYLQSVLVPSTKMEFLGFL